MPPEHEPADRPRHERVGEVLDDALYAVSEGIAREVGNKHPRTALAFLALLAEHPHFLRPPAPPQDPSPPAGEPEEGQEWLVELLADLDRPKPRIGARRPR